MLKKIISQLTGDRDRSGFDPSALQDPVAMQTAWSPLARGGSSFKTAGLHRINEQRIEFRASAAIKLIASVFTIVGLVIMVVFITKKPETANDYIPIGMGLIFAGAGAGILYSGLTPIVFDLGHGYFCKSRKKPELMMDPTQLKRYAPLKRVHALQIISEYIRNKNKSYYSYELNLVLDDGSRVHVIDHGDQRALRADAETLSKFLDKPLWDAS